MFGGGYAIVWGLCLAALSGDYIWTRDAFLRSPQQLLTQWVVGCLIVGGVLLVGGARAPGAALVGSSVGSVVAYLLRGFYGGDHLETLVHGAVILGTVGLVVCGVPGLRGTAGEMLRRRDLGIVAPLGRYPMALALASGTVVVGALLIPRIQAEAASSCSLIDARPVTNASSPFAASCFRGFEDPWLQALLAFNAGFLALLFLLRAWHATQVSKKHEREDGMVRTPWGRLTDRLVRGGAPFLL